MSWKIRCANVDNNVVLFINLCFFFRRKIYEFQTERNVKVIIYFNLKENNKKVDINCNKIMNKLNKTQNKIKQTKIFWFDHVRNEGLFLKLDCSFVAV